MRTLLAIPLFGLVVALSSCGEYFQGTSLVFEFEKLPVLHRISPDDVYNPQTKPDGETCADDAYVAAHKDDLDQYGVPYQQPYEYHAWATINGYPVRIAKFTVRECTVNSQDKVIKNAVTTVSYERLPPDEYQYPKKPSVWYGIVNAVVSSVPAGGVFMDTPVRLDDSATEIFVTREPAGVSDDSGPMGQLLMRGDLVKQDFVYTATLAKVSGSASGLVTAIPAERVSTW